MSTDYPDHRVIAWVSVLGDDGTEKRIPWLRDPKTPEEFRFSEHARRIYQKAQHHQDAQAPMNGKQRRHRNRRLNRSHSR